MPLRFKKFSFCLFVFVFCFLFFIGSNVCFYHFIPLSPSSPPRPYYGMYKCTVPSWFCPLRKIDRTLNHSFLSFGFNTACTYTLSIYAAVNERDIYEIAFKFRFASMVITNSEEANRKTVLFHFWGTSRKIYKNKLLSTVAWGSQNIICQS